MGCGGSKEEKNPCIEYDYEDTNIPNIDAFFNPLKKTCESAETLRKGLGDDKEESLEVSNSW